MFGRTTIDETLESMRTDDGHFGAFLVLLALAFLTAGYAVGSVLAGESPGAQLWTLPLLGACLASMAALVATGDDA